MSQIAVKSPQKPTQIFDAKTICRDCSVGDPTLLPSENKNAHENARLNKALRSSSSRSDPLNNWLLAVLSVFKQSSASVDPKNRRDSPPMSIQNGSTNKISHLNADVEPKIIYPQKTLPLKHKSEVTIPETTVSELAEIKKSKGLLTKSPKIKTGSLPCFELTPLSHLIQQSFRDIERLQQVHATQTLNCPEDANKISGGLNLLCGLPSKDEDKGVDFNRVKDNLKRFEDLYMEFLGQEGDKSEKNEEVHLVAVACKRSQVISGFYKAPIRSPEA